MADGQVLIDSKLDVGGIDKGTSEIRKECNRLSKEVSKVAKEIETGLKDIDVDNLADGMSESFESEGAQIEQAVEQAADSVEQSAEQMADAMEDSAEEQSDSMKKAWDKTEDEAQTGSRKVQDDIEDIGDKAKKTGNDIESGLGNAFSGLASKIGGMMATVFAVDELFEFAKSAVEATADVRAENAQFEQTFKDLAATAEASLKTIQEETGITASRMKKSYTGIYAFTKSIGGTEMEALAISDRAIRAAADSAAYYDRTLEETTETLQSFLKGNYENDAALGIAATETTRNAKANELYAKSFDKLTEAQKVDVLLAMVEAGNEASGAMGQAAREADAWTNVTGELSEAWRQFKAVIGEPLLDLATPVLKRATTALYDLIELSETFEVSDLFGDIDVGPLISSFGEFSAKCSELAEVIASGLKWAWENVLVPLGTWTINAGLPALLSALGGAFDALASTLQWLQPLASAIWNNFLQPLASWTGGAIVTILQSIGDVFTFLAEAFDALNMDSVTWFLESMSLAGSYAQTGMIDPIKTGLDEIAVAGAETFNGLSANAQAGTAAAGAAGVATVEGTVAAMDTIVAAEQEHIAATSEAVVTGNQQILDGVTSNTTAANTAIVADATATGNQIASSYTDAANSAITTAFTPMEESGTATAAATSEAFDDAANTMRTAWGDMGPWFDANVATPIKTSIEGLGTAMSSVMTAMEEATSTAWANMVETVQNSVEEMQSSINSITGKTVYVDVVKTGNGADLISASAGYNGLAYTPATYDITPQIPYLATGAVIPPRAPFMAMLGDQRNGTNLEAPEGLIRKIIQEEMGSIEVSTTVSFAGTLAQFVRMLFPEIKSEARRRGSSLAKEVIE